LLNAAFATPNLDLISQVHLPSFVNMLRFWLIGTDYYSALGPVLAGTRAQSGDRYGSSTLHSGQVLRGSLPLLLPGYSSTLLKITFPAFYAFMPGTEPHWRHTQHVMFVWCAVGE
jgi:hypothetical protein